MIGEAAVRIRPDTAGFAGQVESGLGRSLTRTGLRLGAALGVGFGIKTLIQKTAGVFTDFQQEVANVGSVADATAAQLQALSNQALTLGPTLGVGARAGAAAQFELAKAGVSVKEILGGAFAGTLTLAAAGSLAVGDAATIAANAMKTFGLAGRDVTAVADALSTAANQTTADVGDFGLALAQGGSAARQAGLSFTATVAILESLAEIGIRNSDAGTSLKSTILQLLTPTKQQAALTKKLGIEFVDANGRMKDGVGISAELIRTTSKMTAAQRTLVFATLAGSDGVRTLNALYSAGPAKLKAYERGLKEQGTALETTRKRQNTLRGDLNKLGASFETAGIKAGSSIGGVAREATQELTAEVKRFSSGPDLQRAADTLGQALLDAFRSKDLRANVSAILATGASALSALGAAAKVTGPPLRAVASAISTIIQTPIGPGLLIGAAIFKVLSAGVNLATAATLRLTAATAAGSGAAAAKAAAEGRVTAAVTARAAAESRAAVITAASARTGLTAGQASQRQYQRTFVALGQQQRSLVTYQRTFGAATAATTTGAGKIATSFSRVGRVASTFSQTAGRGMLALAGGPVGVALLAVSALGAGVALLAGRESNAAAAARGFSDALRDQASAAREAQAGLAGMRELTDSIVNANANVTRSFAAQKAAQDEVTRVRAAPAADFGGQAAKAQALKGALNELAVAQRSHNQARREASVAGERALSLNVAEQARIAGQIQKSRELAAATGIQNRAQLAAVLNTRINRDAAIRYTEALAGRARGEAAAARTTQSTVGILRQQAAATDTSTASGKRHAESLRNQARTAQTAATTQRASALSTVTAAISANRQIVNSDKATAAEREKAQTRVKFLDKLADQIRAQQGKSKTAAAGIGKAIAAGLAGAGSQVAAAGGKLGTAMGKGAEKGKPLARKAGEEGGKAVGQGAISQAGTANAAGSAVGSALGTGVISGINAQIPGIFAAGAAAGRAAADGARSTRGGDIKSPSRLMAREVGAPLAEGIAEGMRSKEKDVRTAASALVRAARGAAGAARAEARGLSDAFGTQIRSSILRLGARIKPAISQVLRESIASAKSNLQSLSETVSGALSQVIDAQLQRQVKAIDSAFDAFAGAQKPLRDILDARSEAIDARSQQLDAAAAVDEERRLRNAISLAEAGQSRAQQRLASFEASLAKRSAERTAALSPLAREQERQRLEALRLAAADPAREARAELERFLLAQDQAQISREITGLDRARTIAEEKAAIDRKAAEDTTEARRVALERGFADLVNDLNRGRIKTAAFGEKVKALMREHGVEVSAIGAEMGRTFVEQFNAQLRGLLGQSGALAGFLRGEPVSVTIERPGLARAGEAAAVREALRSSANAAVERLRTQFQAAGSAGKEKITTGEQEQINALKKILNAIVQQPPGSVIEQLLVQAPGSDPSAIADRIIRQAAAAARR